MNILRQSPRFMLLSWPGKRRPLFSVLAKPGTLGYPRRKRIPPEVATLLLSLSDSEFTGACCIGCGVAVWAKP